MTVDELRAELVRRSARDQGAREAVVGWSDDPRTELWNAIGVVDTDNTAWLAEIVTQQGWPRLSDVGEEAATGAWVLAQHADMQPESQRMFHEAMAEALEAGEASPRLFGYLEDRVRVNSGRPQLYGTQFLEDASGMRPRPIESPNRLAERRADVGMDPFEEYEATMHQFWARNNTPDAPAD